MIILPQYRNEHVVCNCSYLYNRASAKISPVRASVIQFLDLKIVGISEQATEKISVNVIFDFIHAW